eukprot:3192409-Prymnesium_polylepis.1
MPHAPGVQMPAGPAMDVPGVVMPSAPAPHMPGVPTPSAHAPLQSLFIDQRPTAVHLDIVEEFKPEQDLVLHNIDSDDGD